MIDVRCGRSRPQRSQVFLRMPSGEYWLSVGMRPAKRLVGSGPAGRLSADRHVPAPPRAGATRAGPFRRPGWIYQRGDEKGRKTVIADLRLSRFIDQPEIDKFGAKSHSNPILGLAFCIVLTPHDLVLRRSQQ